MKEQRYQEDRREVEKEMSKRHEAGELKQVAPEKKKPRWDDEKPSSGKVD